MESPDWGKFNKLAYTIRVDPSREAYDTFFDLQWARDIQLLTAGTIIDEPTFVLCVAWKSVANAHRAPWILVEALKASLDGYARTHKTYAHKVIMALPDKLLGESRLELSVTKEQKLRQAIHKVGREIARVEDQAPGLDVEETWSTLMQSHEFQMSLWGSQRICYGAVYYAYEHFLTECVRTTTGLTDYRPRPKELADDIRNTFGDQLADHCVRNETVNIARLVRNALAHNGGRLTDELKDLRHGIETDDDVLQVMAGNTRRLFDELKVRAYALAEAVNAKTKSGQNG